MSDDTPRFGGKLLRLRRFTLFFCGITALGLTSSVMSAPPPLGNVAVPDVNALGILDGQAPGAGGTAYFKEDDSGSPGGPITKPGKRGELVQLGKLFFWEMQVGGDGIQACASCHYHAGADHRRTAQNSPGLKAGDSTFDFLAVGTTLTGAQFPNGTLPVSEAAHIAAINAPDGVDGSFTVPTKIGNPAVDTNDVVSSQGIHNGTFLALSGGREDVHADVANEFAAFRNVEPRNAPTTLNAIFNFRNFWDGRADAFFNGVSPLGFRDPDDPSVRTTTGFETLRVPFSGAASQAVGPIGSEFEMVYSPRNHRRLGQKLTGLYGGQLAPVTPLAGQAISCTDSAIAGIPTGVLGRAVLDEAPSLLTAPCAGTQRGVTGHTYAGLIASIFDDRFHNDAVCYDATGANTGLAPVNGTCLDREHYTLLQYNFALFFGLAVQAYEATLVSERTMVDLIGGGVATGNLTVNWLQGRRPLSVTFSVNNVPLEACPAAATAAARTTNAALLAAANAQCLAFYAGFIPNGAFSGTEAGIATAGVVPPNQQLDTLGEKTAVLAAVDRGLGRFEAGATGCAICHFNPEFTGATVAAITGFGALPPLEPLAPGQVAREIEAPVVMERMLKFNGLPTVYDAGFYNIGVRPTGEDISLGDHIGGVPLAFTKIAEILAGGDATGYNAARITAIGEEIAAGGLKVPTAPNNLAPRAFALDLGCGPGLVGNGNGAGAPNNAVVNCAPIVAGENLLRNGAFKAQGLRNANFTGPYLHNGSKSTLRAVLEFYKTAGHFPLQNFNNLDAGMRVFALGAQDESAVIELLETGLTDWRVAYEQAPFDHPEICIPHGLSGGVDRLVGITPVGAGGNSARLQSFADQIAGDTALEHDLTDACTIPEFAPAP